METKEEKLTPEIIDKLKAIKRRESDIVFEYGQVSLELEGAKQYVDELQTELNNIYKRASDIKDELDNLLLGLAEKYPGGQLDLEKGVIIF